MLGGTTSSFVPYCRAFFLTRQPWTLPAAVRRHEWVRSSSPHAAIGVWQGKQGADGRNSKLLGPSISRTRIRRMRIAELQDELRKRGLDTTGRRDILIARLLEGTNATPPVFSAYQQQQPSSINAGDEHQIGPFDPERLYVLRLRGHTNKTYGVAGVGLALYDVEQSKEVWSGRIFSPREQTIFEAEYRGLILGLKYIRERGASKLVLQSDNKVILQQLAGTYQVNKEQLRTLYWAAVELKESFSLFEMNIINSAENNRAKNLAQRAVATKKSFGLDGLSESAADSTSSEKNLVNDSPPHHQQREKDDGVDAESQIYPGKTYLLRFDGGSRGNPGIAGAGMVIYDPVDDRELWVGWKYLDQRATNNEAEYNGLLVGLQCARSLGITHIQVEGDSELIVRQIEGRYRVKEGGLKALYAACKEKIAEFEGFELRHIPRAENKRADELANLAMDSRESWGFDVDDPPETPSSSSSSAKEGYQKYVSPSQRKENYGTLATESQIYPGKTYLLRFDGGSRGNPGIAGAGMVIYDPVDDREVSSGWKYLGERATNNEAEYTGLLVGLQSAQSLGITHIQVEGDSELIVRQIEGRYRVKQPRLKVLYAACKEKIAEFEGFELRHIPRAKNTRADELSNQAMDSRESRGFDEE